MSSDLQMVRSQVEGTYNLAIGEPIFLQDTLPWAQTVAPEGPFLYPHVGGEPELLKELQLAHRGMHVVVTVGAKQAISATLYAYRQLYGKKFAYHAAPYWPSYPYLIEKELEYGLNPSALPFGASDSYIKISTNPNNPDGTQELNDCNIWDSAYSHYVYGFTTPPNKWEVAIYSAAKLFGLSGLRVGWIVTSNAAIAAKVSEYVERFTSGVCVTAQRHISYVLRFIRVADDHHSLYARARQTLLANGVIFEQTLSDIVIGVHGVPATGSGMFAFFKAKDDERFKRALGASKVLLIPGKSCGMTEDGWYRMSMGHRNEYTQHALKALAEAYNAG